MECDGGSAALVASPPVIAVLLLMNRQPKTSCFGCIENSGLQFDYSAGGVLSVLTTYTVAVSPHSHCR
jgi:hypothetical protein